MCPQFARLRMQCCALHVAIAQGPFFCQGTCTVDKGVVGWHSAIIVQTNDRTRVIIHFLGTVFVASVSQGQINKASLVEHNAATKMKARTCFRLHAEKHLHLSHAVVLKLASGQSSAPAAGPGRVVGPINPAILSILRVQDHIKQAALALCNHFWQTINRLRI